MEMNKSQKSEVRGQRPEVGSVKESRRQFLGELTGIAAIVCIGGMVAGLRVTPDVIIEDGQGWYPGKVVPLGNVGCQAKWRG
jgi:hypothetical protein